MLDDGVNGIFYISILTLLCSSLALSIKYCYKSKCKTFECCGIKLTRDTDTELKEDMTLSPSSRNLATNV